MDVDENKKMLQTSGMKTKNMLQLDHMMTWFKILYIMYG